MPGSLHVPVPRRRDRLTSLQLVGILGVDLGYGAVFLLGGKAESASQLLLKPLLAPPAWGLLLVAAGVGVWFGWNRGAPALGALVWGALAVASGITIVQGTALSYGGPWLFLGYAYLHGVVLYGEFSRLDAQHKGTGA